LTHTPGTSVLQPSVSPDGTQLSYSAVAAGLSYLETTPVAGGPARRFHRDTTRAYQTMGAWSPDGSAIALSDWNFATDHINLALASLQGGEVRRLTATTDAFEVAPTWTRDGRSLVYVSTDFTSRMRVADVSRLLAARP